MAKKVQVTLIDDLDGSEANEAVSFAFDGTSYTIDLSSAHAAELRAAFAPYVTAARKAGTDSKPVQSGRRRADSAGLPTSEVRSWAKEQGIEVSDRGRIKSDVMVRFQAARL